VTERPAVIEVPGDPEAALAAVARAAEDWGAQWRRHARGGTLALPVLHGLRRGWVRGPLAATPAGEGTALTFTPDEREEHLHGTAVVILLFSAAGAVLTVLWPFVPGLLPLAPFGALLALGGWFLVVSRLRTSGPGDFLELVAHHARAAGAAPPEPGASPAIG